MLRLCQTECQYSSTRTILKVLLSNINIRLQPFLPFPSDDYASFLLPVFIPNLNKVPRDDCHTELVSCKNTLYFIGAAVSLSSLRVPSVRLSIFFQLLTELSYVVAPATTLLLLHIHSCLMYFVILA